jgi:hypothetical protein
MTPKQRRFVTEYMKTFNAKQSAIAAGYSENSAHSIGWENLNKPYIKQEIDKRFRIADVQSSPLPTKVKRTNSTILYLIRDVHFGRTKIGIASNPARRLADLQIGSPVELYIYAYFEVEKAQTHESHLHKRYNHKNLHGEWFDLSDQDLQTICDYLGGYVVVEECAKELHQAKLI